MRFVTSVAVIALLSFPAYAQTSDTKPAAAQQKNTANTTQPDKSKQAQLKTEGDLISKEAAKVPPASAEEFYKGWRARALIDQTVYDRNENDIGEVHDLIVNADGQIVAIIVEGGGFLEIGDAHFRIPWHSVNRTPGKDGVVIDMTQQDISRRGLFDRPEWVATGPREFKISELLGDNVVLRTGVGFGYIADAAFNDRGKMLGVVVNRDVVYGPPAYYYAYPYYGYRYSWDPGQQFYAIPFDTAEDADKATKLDKQRMSDASEALAGSNEGTSSKKN